MAASMVDSKAVPMAVHLERSRVDVMAGETAAMKVDKTVAQ